MRCRLVHSRKVPLPMVVQAAGTMSDVSEAHFSKALSPIEVTEMGNSISVSEAQAAKALSPIDFIDTGRMMVRREWQLRNTSLSSFSMKPWM